MYVAKIWNKTDAINGVSAEKCLSTMFSGRQNETIVLFGKETETGFVVAEFSEIKSLRQIYGEGKTEEEMIEMYLYDMNNPPKPQPDELTKLRAELEITKGALNVLLFEGAGL